MNFWMRQASIQIGSKRYSMDELYFEFDVPFEDSDTLQTATFKLYNLSESTRKAIRRDDVVILNAGYRDDVGVLFVGRLSSCKHEHSRADWITTITATAAMEAWLSKKVYKTYSAGSTAQDIVSDLLNIFGIEIGELSLKVNKTYDRGLVCNGKVQEILRRIVVDDCKSRFLIKNDVIIINDPSTGQNNGVLLSPESGLLLTSNEVQETVIAAGTESSASEEQLNEDGNFVSCECLLNYHIGAAEQIMVQSKTLNGKYLVAKGSHKGSPKGDWKTSLELQAL